ncbi:MAG: helix-turn-helix domain-containing protein [Kurthia sp.]|nr:helix-turn-helix domain-containing protein [Candidatus Kurthia equi]
MTELGTRLKEARMSKGYSLDDLQEKTKIQKRYLSAIEEGNYSVMPGTFYVRAFIKQYAEAVGLDATDLLETYKSELPTNKAAETLGTGATIQKGSKTTDNRRRSTVAKTSGTNKKFSDVMPKFVVAICIIIIIAVIAYLVMNQPNDNAVETKEPATTQENKDVSTENKAAETEKTEAVEEKDEPKQELSKGEVNSDGITTTYTLSNAEEFKIRIEVSGDNWIGLTDENDATIGNSGMFADGDKIEEDIKGKKSVRIRLGAAANGKIFVNDEEVKFVTPVTEQTTQNIVIKLAEEE